MTWSDMNVWCFYYSLVIITQVIHTIYSFKAQRKYNFLQVMMIHKKNHSWLALAVVVVLLCIFSGWFSQKIHLQSVKIQPLSSTSEVASFFSWIWLWNEKGPNVDERRSDQFLIHFPQLQIAKAHHQKSTSVLNISPTAKQTIIQTSYYKCLVWH